MTTWFDKLSALKACPFGRKRAARYESFQELWDALDRGDWMMWALAHGTDISDEVFIACACECSKQIVEDCPAHARSSIRVESTSREELAVIATTPYEHGPHTEKLKTWKRLADVVRSHFPKPPELPE